MKKVIYGVLAFAALTFTACGGAESTEESTDEAKVEEVVSAQYELNPDESKLEWAGSWIGGKNDGNNHNGVIKIMDGRMFQEDGKTYGHFTIDMASIDVQDIDEASGKPKLEGHLSNEDFFNVSQYAVTDVKVIEVNEDNVKIMMIVAGVEMERTVPVTLKTDDKSMTLKGDFTVDFTEAEFKGMQVKEDKPEEGAVSPNIDFKLDVKLMRI